MSSDTGAARAAAGLGGEPAGTPSFPRLRALDRAWYRIERGLCAGMFLSMGLLVFLQQLSDTFATRHRWSDVGVLAAVAVLAVRGRQRANALRAAEARANGGVHGSARAPSGEGGTGKADGRMSIDGVADGGAPSGDGDRMVVMPAWWLTFAMAIAATAVLAAAVYLFATYSAGKLIWTQKFSLVLMMWVALLGASMATYERSHLALEFGEKLWPEAARFAVKAFAHALTSAFCLVALYLSWETVLDQRSRDIMVIGVEWMPMWLAFLVMPYAFVAMAVRFLAQTVTTATKTAAPVEERLPS